MPARPPPHHLVSRGLKPGFNSITEATKDKALGLTFGVYCLEANERVSVKSAGMETALLALSGKGALVLEGQATPFDRASWLEQGPTVLHAAAGTSLEIFAESRCEVALLQTANKERFESRVILPAQIPTEHRGQGKANDTAYRLVRTAFDRSSSPPQAKLVLGEVIALPGKWSSYPPHHHPQPELYFYRFLPEQGYGHAECGDKVYKVQQNDATRILDNKDHAQAAAPGYHMYYLWAIRHLDGQPYTGFEYTPAHRWVFE